MTKGCRLRRALRHILLIGRKEFSDRLRSGWVIACVAVWLGAIGLTSFYGLVQVGRVGLQGYDRTAVSLLNLVQYLVPLLGLLIGHDLVVKEREERTLGLMLASGVSHAELLLGKFAGGCLVLSFPLALGFALAGTGIGLATKETGLESFLILAGSGLGLGVVFVGIGLALSTLCRSRVQALVTALLAWCVAIFVFDLVALGIVISTQAPAAAREIDTVCDPTHLNTAADLPAAYDAPVQISAPPTRPATSAPLSWVYANPVDTFRVLNLSRQTEADPRPWLACFISIVWLAGTLGISLAKLRRIDL